MGTFQKLSIIKNRKWKFNCIWHDISFLNGDSIWYKWEEHDLWCSSFTGPKFNIGCNGKTFFYKIIFLRTRNGNVIIYDMYLHCGMLISVYRVSGVWNRAFNTFKSRRLFWKSRWRTASEARLKNLGLWTVKAPKSCRVNGTKSCILGVSWHILTS
jgi:hypothetical protein